MLKDLSSSTEERKPSSECTDERKPSTARCEKILQDILETKVSKTYPRKSTKLRKGRVVQKEEALKNVYSFAFQLNCCKDKCFMDNFPALDDRISILECCVSERFSFQSLKDQYNFFATKMTEISSKDSKDNGKLSFDYKIGGVSVCSSAFKMAYGWGFNDRHYFPHIIAALEGREKFKWGLTFGQDHETNLYHLSSRLLQVNESKQEDARLWMNFYLPKLSCTNPASRGAKLQIGYLDKVDLHKAYETMRINEGSGDKILPYNHFTSLWKREFSHISTKKEKSVSSKCMVCAPLHAARVSAQKDHNFPLLAKIAHYTSIHVQWQAGFRSWYEGNVKLARRHPDKYFSACSDGAASNQHALPRKRNFDLGVTLVKQKLTGTHVHTKEFVLYRNFHYVI